MSVVPGQRSPKSLRLASKIYSTSSSFRSVYDDEIVDNWTTCDLVFPKNYSKLRLSTHLFIQPPLNEGRSNFSGTARNLLHAYAFEDFPHRLKPYNSMSAPRLRSKQTSGASQLHMVSIFPRTRKELDFNRSAVSVYFPFHYEGRFIHRTI